MIIIRIHGGLGNQMFQYALGVNLSLIHNVPFKIDYSYLKTANQSSRSFRLFGFKISAPESTEQEIKTHTGTLPKILDKFILPNGKKKHVKEASMLFDPNILKLKSGYFDGHWQSEKYFHPYENAIRMAFELAQPFSPAGQTNFNLITSNPAPVSVHIRRGDYVSIQKVATVHGALSLEYYQNAMKEMLRKIPNAHFFVFSDDIDWAKQNFPKEYPLTFVSSPDIPDYEEMTLMSKCFHHIVANSTFSWWGAWLNKRDDKIVIAPKQWYNDTTKNVSDLVPTTWIRI